MNMAVCTAVESVLCIMIDIYNYSPYLKEGREDST
jgi:hypothetical protein